MIQRRSRIPALMMLLAMMAFGVGMVFARRGVAGHVPNAQLKALKDAVGKPDAKPETWLAYGKGAYRAWEQFKDADVAFMQVLKVDPYQKEALSGCAKCLTSLHDVDGFYKFMHETVALDPKLAKAVFEWPAVASYLSEPRFASLRMDAIAGSMD